MIRIDDNLRTAIRQMAERLNKKKPKYLELREFVVVEVGRTGRKKKERRRRMVEI